MFNLRRGSGRIADHRGPGERLGDDGSGPDHCILANDDPGRTTAHARADDPLPTGVVAKAAGR